MQNIKHIIWDLDGVLFHYSDAFIDSCYIAYVDTALRLIDGMDAGTALNLAKKSYEETRAPSKVFIDQYGLDPALFMDIFGDVIGLSALAPDREMIRKMRSVATEHSILTASTEKWALSMTRQLDLSGIFTTENIISQEKYGPLSKSESIEPFLIALKAAGHKPENVLMVEDTQRNLKFAKEAGLTTVLVYPKQDELRENFTDYVFDTPNDFLDELIAHQLRQ